MLNENLSSHTTERPIDEIERKQKGDPIQIITELPPQTDTMDAPPPAKPPRKPRTPKGKAVENGSAKPLNDTDTIYFLVTEQEGSALPKVVTEADGRIAAAQTIVNQQAGQRTILFRGVLIEPDDVFRGKK